MLAFDLPFADAVLKPHDVLSTGATALTTILLDYRHMYHDLVSIINKAEDFYEVSHDMSMAKFDDSCKGNAVTFADLLESLVDVDAYCLPKAKTRRKKRGEGVKEDCEGTIMDLPTRQSFFKPCMIGIRLSTTNNQGRASNFEQTMVSLGKFSAMFAMRLIDGSILVCGCANSRMYHSSCAS
jgi:hypothetical protein